MSCIANRPSYYSLFLAALVAISVKVSLAASDPLLVPLNEGVSPQPLPVKHKVFAVVVDNIDSDGRLDLLTTDRTKGIAQIFYQKTPRNFEAGEAAEVLGFHPNGLARLPGKENQYVLSAEGDRLLKVLGVGERGEITERSRRPHPGAFTTTAFSWPSWGTSLAVAPYEGHGLVLLRNFQANSAQVEKEFSLGHPAHQVPGEITAADLNADSIPELLYTTRRSRTLWRIDYPKDNQEPEPVAIWTAPVGAPRHLAVADINGDSALDILLPLESERRIAVLLNDGKGHFAPGPELPVPSKHWAPHRIAIAENRDGSLLLVASTEKSLMVYRIEKGNPYRFQAVELPLSGRVNQILLLSDIDGDGEMDLLFTLGELEDSLQILYGPLWTRLAKPLAAISPNNNTQKAINFEEAADPARILARVGDETITLAAFREFVYQSGLGDNMRTESGQIKLLRQLIEERLLDQAIKREDLTAPQPLSPEAYAKARRSLEEVHFPTPSVPEDATLRSYYEFNKEDFGIPEMVRLVQIQFRNERDPAGGILARQRAERALQRLEAGEDFTKVASELTENPRAPETGPDRGFVARNAVPWLRDAMRGLQPGQRTGIIPSPTGYEILLLTDVRPALIADYEAVRGKVAAQWQNEQREKARERYLKTLAGQFGVTVVEKGFENANPAK